MNDLDFLTAEVPSTGGAMRSVDDDFRVEEIPAYEPSGDGDHLYVTFEKRGVTTPDAVRAIARALEIDPREAGWAGLKDRHGVTVQTASFLRGNPERAMSLTLPGIRVLQAKRHKNKLKSGHLHGNRFVIRLRGCTPGAFARATAVRDRLLATGVPNYYGEQRFGRDGDNADRGRAWLIGTNGPPRDAFLRKMYVSALQSDLFNRYVVRRLRDGLLDRYLDGDLAVRHPVGGPFAIDPAEAVETYLARRCSATGPMFGHSMRWPEREARVREEQILAEGELTTEHFRRARDLGEGTRRAVRICLDALDVREITGDGAAPDTTDLELAFALPAGGYATTVIREFRKSDDEGLKPAPILGIESPNHEAASEG